MAMALTHLPRWLWGGKQHETRGLPTSSSSSSSSSGSSVSSSETVKFQSIGEGRRRGRGRERRKFDRRREGREYDDLVMVPSDGGCISGSESDDSDWSIGWFEPHAPDFSNDFENESDNSFAVLVPCYGLPPSQHLDSGRHLSSGVETPNTQLLDVILANLSNASSDDSKRHVEQWLSSLHEQ